MSVVALDMSSTTRRDSQKQIFWTAMRDEPEPLSKKDRKKKIKQERKAQERVIKVKRQKVRREFRVRNADEIGEVNIPLVSDFSSRASETLTPTPQGECDLQPTEQENEARDPVLTPGISLMVASVPRSVRPERPAPPIVPPPSKLVFSPRNLDSGQCSNPGWGSKMVTENEKGIGWTRMREKIAEGENKPVKASAQRFGVSSSTEAPSIPTPPNQRPGQNQWQWQKRAIPQQLSTQISSPVRAQIPVEVEPDNSADRQQTIAEGETSDFLHTSSSSSEFDGEETFGCLTISSLTSMASDLDVSSTLSQFSKPDESSSDASSSTEAESDDEKFQKVSDLARPKTQPFARRVPPVGSIRRSYTGHNPSTQPDSQQPEKFNTIGATSPRNREAARHSYYTSESSSSDELLSLSAAVGNINMDLNFSLNRGDESDSSDSESDDSDSYDSSSYDSSSEGFSDLKGLAGGLSLDTSSGSEESDSSDSSSYEQEEERVQVIPRPGVEVVLGKKLGKGATATVWSGTYDGKPVAVKQITLKAFKEGEQHAQAAVKREYDTVKSIDHPSVIRYYGIFYNKQDQEVNIVMELINGISLTDLVFFQDGLSEDHSSYLLKHILIALSYLHDQCHLIHRDVKPDNILLDKAARVKIIDFGTATSVDPQDAMKRRSTVGTPWYCAPEIVNDEAYAYRVDVWSIGCMALEFVTGEPPFCNLNDIECLFKMSEKKAPPIPEEVSGNCRDFLVKCLDPESKTRPTTTDLLGHSFVQMTDAQEKKLWGEIRSIVRKMTAARDRASLTT
eukprot:TRINITY_DN4497_c0_g1_i1.p1 TRINITY_DN4497_c0_g1~~TRINITY_DN4497_c0_g1_i1.p1  ORF type:complete len:913 (-),score=171.95 TRINITY_DN4497_c0_g1_i1:54-2426(-)